jgi:hypothetical protein
MTKESGTSQILEQALRSSDDILIDYMLTKTPTSQIPSLISGLDRSLVIPFIRVFARHIERFPQSLAISLPWIEGFIDIKRNDISTSWECQKRIADLQNVMKQRTQHIGLFMEAQALSTFVYQEREAWGIGLPVVDTFTQNLTE